MRTILRTLPIRWQIPALYAVILALVLAAGGIGLWNAQRTFLYDGLVARQLAEARAIIPDELSPKLQAALFSSNNSDPVMLKEHYAKIVAKLLPAGADLATARKQIALLDPKLADQFFPPGAELPSRDEMKAILSKLVFELFPPDEEPLVTRKRLSALDPDLAADLFPSPAAEPAMFRKYAESIAWQASAKERGVLVLALDGSVLAQSSIGQTCQAFNLPKDAIDITSSPFYKQIRNEPYFETVEPHQLTLILPLIWQQNRPLALAQLCISTAEIDANLDQLALSLLVGWTLIVGLATALGVTATRRVLRPLDQVIDTTARIAAGDLRQRVGLPPGRGEIAKLGAAFDAMVERLEAAFAVQRRFVADAAHELRTPLTALSASVELLRMGAAEADPATAGRLLRHLDGELGRVIRLTNDLLMLSRLDTRPQIDARPVGLSALLEEIGDQSRALLSDQQLQVEIAPALRVYGDPDRLRQVVLNLLDNARKYTPSGGRIRLRAYADQRPTTNVQRPTITEDRRLKIDDSNAGAGEMLSSTFNPRSSNTPSVVGGRSSDVVIEVQDTGVGIAAEALPHLFERFYRVDGARARASGGSGLGLAIVQAIVEAHGGQVWIASVPGQGTCVTIRLPWQLDAATTTSVVNLDNCPAQLLDARS
jgi:two-component system, OmpR family, sensor kinase